MSFFNIFIYGFKRVWAQARNNYWAIPAFSSLLTFIIFCIIFYLDSTFSEEISNLLPYKFSSEESIRSVLTTVGTSLMTVTGVIFSITLLCVVHASSQIGPRLLSGFMENRANQWAMGVFLSAFTYAVLALSVINVRKLPPQLTFYIALLLTGLSIATLVFFVHNVPRSIRMTHVVSHIGHILRKNISSYFKQFEPVSAKDDEFIHEKNQSLEIKSNRLGYIQSIDYSEILERITENQMTLSIKVRPGDFIHKDQNLAVIHAEKKVTEKQEENLRREFVVGSERSTNQDFVFGANLLVEVAIRALSPGVNDPYTACECIDQLEVALILLSEVSTPDRLIMDSKGKIRLQRPAFHYNDFVTTLMRPLVFYSSKDPLASRRLKDSLDLLQRKTNHPDTFQKITKTLHSP